MPKKNYLQNKRFITYYVKALLIRKIAEPIYPKLFIGMVTSNYYWFRILKDKFKVSSLGFGM